MDIDYSLLLFILALVCGLVWGFDSVFLLKKRISEFQEFAKSKEISVEEIEAFAATQEEQENNTNNSEDSNVDDKQRADDAKLNTSQRMKNNVMQEAISIQQEPIVVEYARSFFPILFAVLVFRSFLFEPFQIPTGSMIPSLNVGDFIVVNKYSYGLRLPVVGTKILSIGEPKRGDVMVFIPPHEPQYYVKRVVGLPGDHVRYEDKIIYINGEPMTQEFVAFLDERLPPVIHQQELLGDVLHDIYQAPSPRYMGSEYFMQPEGRTIPEGHYFMMGDNRDNSDDSRRWGVVPEENIVGRAVAVWMHKEPGIHLPTFSQNRLINP